MVRLSMVVVSGLLCGLACGVLGGCDRNEFQPPPPPTVVVATPWQRDVVEYEQFTGTTAVAELVDVRARVTGVLESIDFEPGAVVQAGDLLFRIDSVPFVAARDAQAAKVESARAELKLAQNTADRIKKAAERGAATELEVLEVEAQVDVAAAALLIAERELTVKELDVEYTEIHAPITGRAEESPFEVGDLVGTAGEASLLTTIYDDTEVHVYFSAPDRLFLEAIRREGRGEDRPAISIGTEIDEGFPFIAQVDYADPEVDAATGTIRVRAVVENADRQLMGGLFVRARLATETIEDALVVPQIAIGADQVGSYVLVVDGAGVVERRDVTLGAIDGGDRVITSGITAQDRVVVRGLLQARPGSTVNPQPAGQQPAGRPADPALVDPEQSDSQPNSPPASEPQPVGP